MGGVLRRIAVNGIFLSFVLLSSSLFTGEVYGQWVAGYTYKSKLTISGAQVCGAAALTNFPILIQINGTFIRPTPTGLIISANGYDVIFTANDGTTILSHQIDHYNGTTGEYVAWVKIPSLPPGSDTDIYMYYGNSSVVTDPSTQATWDVNFRTVYHFENNNLNDATSNGINGTNNGTTNFATAKIGEGRDFDGAANYIQTTSTELQTADNFTLSTWFKADALDPTHIIWQGESTENGWGDGGISTAGQELHLSTGTCCGASSGYLSTFLGHTDEQLDANGITAETTFTETTAWHHLVATYSNLSTSPSGQLYLDGVLINTNIGTTAATPRDLWNTNLQIGRPGPAERFFDGKLDEIRILNTALSPDWICTEYNNQNNPSGFTTLTNRAPDLNTIEGANLNYTEGDPATAITASLTASDWDNSTFNSATVSITSNYLSTEDVLAFTDAFGITGSWSSGTGVLTLSGTATISDYVSALHSVTYRNTNINNPSSATRTIQFRVNDGTNNSNILSRNVTVTPVNPYYNLVGNTAEISPHCFTITPPLGNMLGAIWRKTPTALQSSFEINFDARFSADGVVKDSGADGIVFVLQRDLTPPPSNTAGSPIDALGANGQGLGYGGISPSIGVAFDTYMNGSQPNYDFIALSKNGNVANLLTAEVAAKVDVSNNPVNIEDGVYHSIKITWQKSTNTLKVFFDGSERVSYSEDFINTVFGGDATNIYWGITASTGGSNNEQGVCGIAMNFAPTAVADSYIVAEGGTITQVAPGVLANDTDAEGNALTAVLGATTTNGTLTLNANGSFTYVHNGSETTSDSFTYSANDGSANGDLTTVSISITPVNDAPVTMADAYTVAEGGTITQDAPGVLANDTDAEGNALTAVLGATTTNGTLTLNANGSFTYVHNGSETTSDSFTYQVNDGTVNGGLVTVSITITAVNDAPVTVADSYTVAEGGTINQAAPGVLVNDTDAEGNPLTTVLTTTTTNGTLTLNANGSFTYIHNDSETISDSFTYSANDGTTNGNVVTVSITITPVNDAPIAADDNASLTQDASVAISVLANDSDVDDPIIPTSIVIVSAPANGILSEDPTGVITYTANPGYVGNDSFTYTIQDPSGLTSNTATVSITVTPINDPPVAVDDGPFVHESPQPLLIEVMANDSDPDNTKDELTIISVSNPLFGTVTIVNNQVSYQPSGTASGNDTFTYTISDPDGLTSTAVVTIQYIYNPLTISEGFSPNGDASNDQWYIKGIENYPNNMIKVFNRWGLLVYEAKNYNNDPGWNGLANAGQEAGKLLDHGTYYYLLYLGTSGKTVSGYITIIR